MGFVDNLILLLTMQKLWKSVYIDKVITDYVVSCFMDHSVVYQQP